jgi:hypothetical protein
MGGPAAATGAPSTGLSLDNKTDPIVFDTPPTGQRPLDDFGHQHPAASVFPEYHAGLFCFFLRFTAAIFPFSEQHSQETS